MVDFINEPPNDPILRLPPILLLDRLLFHLVKRITQHIEHKISPPKTRPRKEISAPCVGNSLTLKHRSVLNVEPGLMSE